MKNKVIVLLLSLFVTGCAQDKVEVLPDYESIYYSDDQVDITAEPKNEEKWLEIIEKDFLQCTEKILKGMQDTKLSYHIKYRFFISEDGKVEKAKNLSKELSENENQKLFKCFLSTTDKWNLAPAKREGKNVKSWTDLNLEIIKQDNGKFKVELDLNFEFGDFFLNSDKFATKVDVQPEIIGGMESLLKAIVYPETAKKEGIEGRVMVLTFIDENGNVVKTKIIKSAGEKLDEAAEKALESIKFKPAQKEGKKVKTTVTIPIVFKLD